MEGRTEVETDPIIVRRGGNVNGEDGWRLVRVEKAIIIIVEHIGLESIE